jgi:hypothetical protein
VAAAARQADTLGNLFRVAVAMEILCILAVVLVFEFAVFRWGVDSRDGPGLPGDRLGL